MSADIAPYRPDRKDETFRRLNGGTIPEVEAESAVLPPIAPSHDDASNPRTAAAAAFAVLEPGSTPLSNGLPQPRPHPYQWAQDGGQAPALVLASPLPPAGLRATLTSRLHAPLAKKRRLERGGGGDDAGRLLGTKKTGGVGPDDWSPLGTTIEISGGRGGRRRPATAPSSPSIILQQATAPVAETAAATGAWVPPIGSLGTEGSEDRAVRRRGAVVAGGGPWTGMNFADINAADDHVSSHLTLC